MTTPVSQDDASLAFERHTKTIPISGREVLIQTLTHAQFMQMGHEYGLLRNDTTPEPRKMKTLDRIFRIMRSLIVDDDDREFVEDLIADGTLDMNDLIDALREIYEEEELLKNGPVSKVRRGRSTQRRR